MVYLELTCRPAVASWTWPEGATVLFLKRDGHDPEDRPQALMAAGIQPPSTTDPAVAMGYWAIACLVSEKARLWRRARYSRLVSLPVPDSVRGKLLSRAFREVRLERSGISASVYTTGLDTRDYNDLLAMVLAVLDQVPVWERLIVEQQYVAGYRPS
jgi:hypothetical protein